MPLRSPKMNGFIFGFQRLVWCPKCTPASSRSFIASGVKLPPSMELAFAELEALSCAGHAVLLPFLGAGVACEQAVLLQPGAQFGIELAQRTGNPQANRAGLSGDATAGHRGQHIELLGGLGERERRLDVHARRLDREELFELSVIDGDRAGTGAEENTRRRLLTAPGRVVLSSCHVIRPRRRLCAGRRADACRRRTP